jgi:hypothetical protein
MNARRTIGSVLATALAATSLGVVATAAPASAATVVPTRVVMQVSKPTATYQDKVSGTGQVQGQNADGTWGSLPYGSGGAALQFLPKGSATWQTLQTDDSASSFYFYPVVAQGTGTFRVAYAGGAYQDYQFTVSESSKALKVERKLTTKTISGKRAGFKGKLSPAAKTKITVFKKQGKKFKKFKTLRSNGKGRFTVVLPAPRRGKFHWKIVFKGNSQFAPSAIKGSTYKGF